MQDFGCQLSESLILHVYVEVIVLLQQKMFIMLSFLPLFCNTGVKIYEVNLNFLSEGNVVDFRQKSLSVTDLSVVIISCAAELLRTVTKAVLLNSLLLCSVFNINTMSPQKDFQFSYMYTHTDIRLTAPFPGLPR